MIKKILSVCLLSIAFASAQVVDDPYAYTSGAQEQETPVVNINHTENDEPMFAVSIHPVSMFILSLFDIPSIFLTIEGNLASHVSLITRPYIVWAEFSDSDEDLDIFLFGISEGLRVYLNEGHRGLYLAGHFNYDRVSLEYTYEGKRTVLALAFMSVTSSVLAILRRPSISAMSILTIRPRQRLKTMSIGLLPWARATT